MEGEMEEVEVMEEVEECRCLQPVSSLYLVLSKSRRASVPLAAV